MNPRIQLIVTLSLYCLCFYSSLVWVYLTLSSQGNYENTVFLLIIFLFVGCYLFLGEKTNKIGEYSFYYSAFIGLSSVFMLDLFNQLFWNFNIISAVLFFYGVYFILGFFINQNIWRRGFFIVAMIGLSLPFIEHIQTFLGFPVRVFTAKMVSYCLDFLGYSAVNYQTVILAENNATSVDLPCSGVKSLYIGSVFMLCIYFIKNVRISFRLLIVSAFFYLALLFFNFWRIFSLIYLTDIAELEFVGGLMHVALGVIGFALSLLVLWHIVQFLPKFQSNESLRSNAVNHWWCLIVMLISFLALKNCQMLFDIPSHAVVHANYSINFMLPGVRLHETNFTEKELKFFDNQAITFHKKYHGNVDGTDFLLLFVGSYSWRSHHNPEICIQGLGYTISQSDIRQFNGNQIREITLENQRGRIFYWFVAEDAVIADYSERVWQGILHPNKHWTLAVLTEKTPKSDERVFLQLMNKINDQLQLFQM